MATAHARRRVPPPETVVKSLLSDYDPSAAPAPAPKVGKKFTGAQCPANAAIFKQKKQAQLAAAARLAAPRPVSQASRAAAPAARPSTAASMRPATTRTSRAPPTVSGAQKAPIAEIMTPARALEIIRTTLAKRNGGLGFRNLTRLIRIYDRDDDAQLSAAEFGVLLHRLGLVASPDAPTLSGDPSEDVVAPLQEAADAAVAVRSDKFPLSPSAAAQLFSSLDANGNGNISIKEFASIVRPPPVKRRVALIKQAFECLDGDDSGVVTLAEMFERYNVDGHPAVKSGKMSKEDAMKEFMKWWDQDGDGVIEYKEFYATYKDMSATIDNDDYFELMMRNAWRMSGGKGAAANTANIRVLVEFRDGTSKVVEVENTLGVKAGDVQSITARLIQQGVRNIKKVNLSS